MFIPFLLEKLQKKGKFEREVVSSFHGIVGIPMKIVAALFSDPWKVKFYTNYVLSIIAYQCACLAQVAFQALALEVDDAKNVAFSSSISCVVAFIGQVTIFKATVDWLAVFGSIIMVAAVFLLQLRQALE